MLCYQQIIYSRQNHTAHTRSITVTQLKLAVNTTGQGNGQSTF